MNRILPIALVLIIVIAVLAYFLARSNASYNNTKTENIPTNTSQNTPATDDNSQTNVGPSAIATDKVTIEDFAFNPSNITVERGTVVTWTNEGNADHTVTETDGQDGPKSEHLAPGESYAFTFNTLGTYRYNCSLHPNMTGIVTVTERSE
jgi:plastocyanin